MFEEELGFIDWLTRVKERISFLQLNIEIHKDISEEDYFLLEVLHKVWYNGELPFYQKRVEITDEKAEQPIFGDTSMTEIPKFVGGIVIDTEAMNQ
jgi:hypothetical protein